MGSLIVPFSGSFLWTVEIKTPRTAVLLKPERVLCLTFTSDTAAAAILLTPIPTTHTLLQKKRILPSLLMMMVHSEMEPPSQLLAPQFIDSELELPLAVVWSHSFHNPMLSFCFLHHKRHVLLAGQEEFKLQQDLCLMHSFPTDSEDLDLNSAHLFKPQLS